MDATKKSARWMQGSLCLIAGPVALVAVQAVTRLIMVGRVGGNGDVYALASQRAIADPAVTQALGSPIKASIDIAHFEGSETTTLLSVFNLPITKLRSNHASGVIRMHLVGAKDQGTLFATATTSALGWTLQTLSVQASKAATPIELRQKKD